MKKQHYLIHGHDKSHNCIQRWVLAECEGDAERLFLELVPEAERALIDDQVALTLEELTSIPKLSAE